MTIASELQDLQTNLQAAKSAVTNKGGTVGDTGLAGLATEIAGIPGGGGSVDWTDSEAVYEATRPSDWIDMPEEVNDNEMYWLLHIPTSETGDILIGTSPMNFAAATTTVTVEFGTTSNKTFVPDPNLTVVLTASQARNGLKISIPATSFSNPTSDSKKQILMKISADGDITTWSSSGSNNSSIKTLAVEFSGKTHFTTLSNTFQNCNNLRYISLVVTSSPTSFSASYAFGDCRKLICLPVFETSRTLTGINYMFNNCYSLVVAPELSVSGNANASSMFYNCFGLKYVPSFDSSAIKAFNNMFYLCYSLVEAPNLDTSSGTNFSSMFNNCLSLTKAPNLDTSNGTNLSYMFTNCQALQSVPSLDTSAATDMTMMFGSCISLRESDFTDYDFTHISSTQRMNQFLGTSSSVNVVTLGNKFGANGICSTGVFMSTNSNDNYPAAHVKITKTDEVLKINSTGTYAFQGNNIYVYVPDSLLASYQADTNWASLDTAGRLKTLSDFPYIPS